MADIKTEVQSIRDFVSTELPNTKFYLQNMPDKFSINELAIELVNSKAETETAYHYRLDRTYQIVYFGSNKLDCLSKMQAVERKINDQQLIELQGKARYLRIGSFSLSQSFKTETTGVYAVIGMLEAELREARTQEVFTKIQSVTPTTISKSDASTWGMIDGSNTPDTYGDGFTFEDIEAGATVYTRGTELKGDGFTFAELEAGGVIIKEDD